MNNLNRNNLLNFWRVVLVLSILLTPPLMIQIKKTVNSFRIEILHSGWIFFFAAISILFVAFMTLFCLSWSKWQLKIIQWTESITRLNKWWRIVAGLVFLSLPAVLSIAVIHPLIGLNYFPAFITRLALLWGLALVGMFCVRIIKNKIPWLAALGISSLTIVVVLKMAAVFSNVSTYPFALGWSDVSRFYGASLFFSKRLYGNSIPLPLLHPAWHLLLTPPYLLGNVPIWIHRLWQALLVNGLTILLAVVLAKRLRLNNRLEFWMVALWAFLFISQGPIIIHLMVCALIGFAGTRSGKFWLTTLIVVAASIWAGWCRINWFPVPGLMAAMFYLLETPVINPILWPKYFLKPIFWTGIGFLTAIASNMAFIRWSGNGSGGNFMSSLSSDLLLYRLLPSSTYSRGVLLDLLLVTLPLILIIAFILRRKKNTYHTARLVCIAGILLVLCVGGLIVCVKIGGGSDLHNMDAYLIFLMIVTGYLLFGRVVPDTEKPVSPKFVYSQIGSFLLTIGIAIPILYGLINGKAITTWDFNQSEAALVNTKQQAEDVAAHEGEVLFISQRHLLALKVINVPLIPEGEQDNLMEMVMSHNRVYLDRFQSDLEAQRFEMIVAGNYSDRLQENSIPWSEENNLWVQEVVIPLRCFYEIVNVYENQNVAIYKPRTSPCK
jgi:hypothetical protein